MKESYDAYKVQDTRNPGKFLAKDGYSQLPPVPSEHMAPFVWAWNSLKGPKGVQRGQTGKGWAYFGFTG